MKPVILDASVFVAAADPVDAFHGESRRLLEQLVRLGVPVTIPAFALTEIACALSRRLREPTAARELALRGLAALQARELPMDNDFLARATVIGTTQFLRGADALYAAAAITIGGRLISLDAEHQSRAGAISPTKWLAANG